MLEELQTLALVGLLVSTYYLTIGCRKIGDSLPDESGHISSRIDATSDKIGTMTEVLDDIANLLNEGLGALAGNRVESPSNPVEMILSSVISRMTMPQHDGPKQEEWTIQQNDSPPTLETENQLD
jgi:hypothetical protein